LVTSMNRLALLSVMHRIMRRLEGIHPKATEGYSVMLANCSSDSKTYSRIETSKSCDDTSQ
jgi:hypothetical protein